MRGSASCQPVHRHSGGFIRARALGESCPPGGDPCWEEEAASWALPCESMRPPWKAPEGPHHGDFCLLLGGTLPDQERPFSSAVWPKWCPLPALRLAVCVLEEADPAVWRTRADSQTEGVGMTPYRQQQMQGCGVQGHFEGPTEATCEGRGRDHPNTEWQVTG